MESRLPERFCSLSNRSDSRVKCPGIWNVSFVVLNDTEFVYYVNIFFLIYILNVRIQVDKSCLVVNSRSDGTAVAIVIGATARVITVQLLHTAPALVDIRALLSGIAP